MCGEAAGTIENTEDLINVIRMGSVFVCEFVVYCVHVCVVVYSECVQCTWVRVVCTCVSRPNCKGDFVSLLVFQVQSTEGFAFQLAYSIINLSGMENTSMALLWITI